MSGLDEQKKQYKLLTTFNRSFYTQDKELEVFFSWVRLIDDTIVIHIQEDRTLYEDEIREKIRIEETGIVVR